MKEIIPLDSRYIPFTQQRSCCFPTCLLMIMYKYNIPLLSQELLASHFGLIVSPESKDFFWNAETGEKPQAGYGTRIYLDEYEPNKVLKKLSIPLELKTISINSFSDEVAVLDYLAEIEKKDADVLACFNHQALKQTGSGGGHLTLFDRVDWHLKKIRLVDPSYNQPKWRIVESPLLVEAMKKHEAGLGGFWEINKI